MENKRNGYESAENEKIERKVISLIHIITNLRNSSLFKQEVEDLIRACWERDLLWRAETLAATARRYEA